MHTQEALFWCDLGWGIPHHWLKASLLPVVCTPLHLTNSGAFLWDFRKNVHSNSPVTYHTSLQCPKARILFLQFYYDSFYFWLDLLYYYWTSILKRCRGSASEKQWS